MIFTSLKIDILSCGRKSRSFTPGGRPFKSALLHQIEKAHPSDVLFNVLNEHYRCNHRAFRKSIMNLCPHPYGCVPKSMDFPTG